VGVGGGSLPRSLQVRWGVGGGSLPRSLQVRWGCGSCALAAIGRLISGRIAPGRRSYREQPSQLTAGSMGERELRSRSDRAADQWPHRAGAALLQGAAFTAHSRFDGGVGGSSLPSSLQVRWGSGSCALAAIGRLISGRIAPGRRSYREQPSQLTAGSMGSGREQPSQLTVGSMGVWELRPRSDRAADQRPHRAGAALLQGAAFTARCRFDGEWEGAAFPAHCRFDGGVGAAPSQR
jgi:hypothetical protein